MPHTLLHLAIDYCKTLLLLGEEEVEISPEATKQWQAFILQRSKPAAATHDVNRRVKSRSSDASTHGATVSSSTAPSATADLIVKEATAPAGKASLSTIPLEGTTKEEQLANLRAQVARCMICPHLAATRTQTVFSSGNPHAALMFVGEAPGKDEDEQGEPFVGAAGQLLTKMISAMGLTRNDVYIANVLKCRPDMPEGSTGNRKPTHEEMHHCLPYLLAQIQIVAPRLIIALGATAVEGLLGEKKVSMTKIRGKVMDFHGIPLIPTYHPAYLLYNQSIAEKRKVWEDLLQAMELLGLPISEKQRGYFSSANKG